MESLARRSRWLTGSPRRLIVIGIVAAVAIGAAAYAYFTSTGTGSAAATVGSASNWTVAVTGTSGGPLLPGSGTETVDYTVTNPSSSGAQQLNSVAVSIQGDGSGDVFNTSTNSTATGCKATWFSVDDAGAPATPQTLTGGQSVPGSADVTMQDSGTNQNACQNVSPKLTVSAG